MLTFIPFKSKQFIFLISLYCKSKRYLSQLQTIVEKDKYLTKYIIHGKYHRDERDENGRVLPVSIWSDGSQLWYINGKYSYNRGL